MGISWNLTIRLDYEVNDSILKRLSMRLDTIFFMYISMRDFQKYMYYTSGFANHFLLLWWSLKTSTDELTYYVIKEKAALELEGVLVRRLNRNCVKTTQIGQYTFKIN
jgi:hypothetical protein